LNVGLSLIGVENGSRKLLKKCVRFEVFTAVTMKNGVFWDVIAVWRL
jgi:hypothetical protein